MNWKKLIAKIKAWFKSLGGASDTTTPAPPGNPPDGPPAPTPTYPEHITRQVATWWGGVKMAGATVDARYALSVSADGRVWSAAPGDWPIKDGDLQTIVCAAYERGGKWCGGKFDWNRVRPSPRDWKNIESGYNGWIAPPNGTTLRVWAASIDGKRVSTEATCRYK